MQRKNDRGTMSTLKLALVLLGAAAVVGGVYKIYTKYFDNNQ